MRGYEGVFREFLPEGLIELLSVKDQGGTSVLKQSVFEPVDYLILIVGGDYNDRVFIKEARRLAGDVPSIVLTYNMESTSRWKLIWKYWMRTMKIRGPFYLAEPAYLVTSIILYVRKRIEILSGRREQRN